MSSQYRLIVNINDENDCAPKFTQLNYQFRAVSSSPMGFFVGQVQANDDDYSPNFRHVQYKIVENDTQDIIRIDPNDGSLFLVRQPSEGMKFNITVIAIDQQNYSLYDQANIEILLFDETTCLSTLSRRLYVLNTIEHRRTPYEIGKVKRDRFY